MGGLGYVVWFDFQRTLREKREKGFKLSVMMKRLGEHTKLVLAVTGFLILFGAICIFCMEYDNPETLGNMGLGDKENAVQAMKITYNLTLDEDIKKLIIKLDPSAQMLRPKDASQTEYEPEEAPKS